MSKKIYIIPLILFLIVILTFLYFLISQRDPNQVPSALINKKVPSFSSTSLFNNKIILSDEIFVKKTFIVNFFATWCAPCRIEHAYIEKLSRDDNIKIIGINYKDESKKTMDWLKELGNPYFEVLEDKEGKIGLEWGVYGLPETFVINDKNIIVHKHIGPITEKNFKEFYKKVKESYN